MASNLEAIDFDSELPALTTIAIRFPASTVGDKARSNSSSHSISLIKSASFSPWRIEFFFRGTCWAQIACSHFQLVVQ